MVTSAATTEVCNLSKHERQDRIEMIRNEILPQVKRSEELENGLAWEFEPTPDMQAKLERLVALERQCCGGLQWSLGREPDSGRLRLAVEGVDPRSGFFASLGARAER